MLELEKELRPLAETQLPVGADGEKLAALSQSPDGQKVRAMLGDEAKLTQAIQNGDTAALRAAMETVLRSEEGKRLFTQLGAILRKP